MLLEAAEYRHQSLIVRRSQNVVKRCLVEANPPINLSREISPGLRGSKDARPSVTRCCSAPHQITLLEIVNASFDRHGVGTQRASERA
jgi:hypothetical protein